ncbi:helix-turn-helix transcriptional regulator [Eggerthella sp. YY7918]|uniref:helix-turn-helix transcriptional regulator n=1 Tax=Eggerthella sp. (strain YY7918) TaxID=502558 RepID=UPI000217161A|nr:helix-turn-helix transcriptional regulator [Eggerthella sp. YY7918]BAK44986.1 hypothetical protein EGYY_18530 [Eggerthella sp. YY7918]
MASVIDKVKKMFDFDVRPAIVVGLALHWSWIWILFWSSSFYPAFESSGLQQSEALLVDTLWFFSLLANALGLIALFFMGKRLGSLGSRLPFLVVAAVLTTFGSFIVAYPYLLFSPEVRYAGYIVGALLTGAGSAIEFVLWGELLTILGMRQTVVYGVAATIVGGVLYMVTIFFTPFVVRFIAALFPLVEMALFWRQRDIVMRYRAGRVLPVADDAPAAAPSRHTYHKDLFALVVVSLFFATSYGTMKGMFVFGSADLLALRDIINIVALALGAVTILLTMSVFKMDFNHLTYQVALPLMAMGFVCVALPGSFELLGFFFHQLGYQYFYIILWALWPALARNNKQIPAVQFCAAGIASIQTGQLLGSVLGSQLMKAADGRYEIAMISVVAVFIILLVALFAFGNSQSQSGWGVLRPWGEGEVPVSKFYRACEGIAVAQGLSARETEVFHLLSKGRNCEYISKQLVITEATTKTHIQKIYRKLGVHSQQALLDLIEFERKNL